jgi:hypothetical protein
MVSKRGCAPALRALYRLSLPRPESLAICAMPRALVAERGNEYVRIWVLGGGRKIFRDDRIVIEMRSRVECFVSCFPFPHRFAPFNSRAIFFALAMSFVWDAFTPPASKTLHGRSGSRVVDPIPRPDMDTHFGNAFANRFAIAEISKCRATKASQDSGLCFLVVKIG